MSNSVDELSNVITKAIRKAESKLPKSSFNKHTKPYWTPEVKALHNESRRLRRIWISEGRPRDRTIASCNKYKIAKSNFRRLQRHESSEYVNKKNEELELAAEVDYRLFWRMLRVRKPKQNHACTEIRVDNKTYKDDNIAEGFGEYFSQVFKDKPESNSYFNEIINKKLCYFKQQDTGDFKAILEAEVTINELSQIIKYLKKRKSPGYDKILNEHIIHGGQRLHECICLLFNTIIASEQTPELWKTSIIIPLFKGHGKNKTLPNSYRPISLLCCLNKMFEKLVLDRCMSFLKVKGTQFPCSQQQGFQKGLSCITTSFNLQESIFYQIEQKAKFTSHTSI